MRLKDKSAVITGGSAGIGRAIAEAMIQEGARVLIGARHEDVVRQTAEAIGAEWCVLDTGEVGSIKQIIDLARDRFSKLDILVNNAAVATPALPIQDTEEADFDRLVAVNLKGYFTAMKLAYPLLKETRGCVLNISSMAGVTGQERHAAYAATKGGINALTKCAAVDWGPDRIRVNALCPTGVWTDALRTWCDEQPNQAEIEQYLDRIHSLGYCPGPEEIASVALFLCSEDAKFMTGAIVPVSGGSECGYKL
jgi:meso-butanediol dehydrogenase / (S,S)-butanediol dehydrogenase / diacetyl reductase